MTAEEKCALSGWETAHLPLPPNPSFSALSVKLVSMLTKGRGRWGVSPETGNDASSPNRELALRFAFILMVRLKLENVLFLKIDFGSNTTRLEWLKRDTKTLLRNRGYYTVARRYEFYFRVVKTIFYERAKSILL